MHSNLGLSFCETLTLRPLGEEDMCLRPVGEEDIFGKDHTTVNLNVCSVDIEWHHKNPKTYQS